MSRRHIPKAPRQCLALARDDRRCNVTTNNNSKDAEGNKICEPLLAGLHYCRFHLPMFSTQPCRPNDPLLFFLDLETTGLNVLKNHIVELALLNDLSSAVYSTVVCPPVFAEGPTVHGIPDDELCEGLYCRDQKTHTHMHMLAHVFTQEMFVED